LSGQNNVLEMAGDSRRALFNGVMVWLSAPPVRSWGRWTMIQSDVDKVIAPLVNPSQALRTEGRRVVVLDAGHGGEDEGAANARYRIQEKHVTLTLANAVRDLLLQHDVDVRLTRTTDRAMDLQDRCEYAARARASVFVSIHLNAATNQDSCGIETHVLPPTGCPVTCSVKVTRDDGATCPGNGHDGPNMVLGYLIQKQLVKETDAEDRGVRRSRFYVLKNAPCPAALVECGFVSNRREAQKLLNAEYNDRIARALAKGIMAYLDVVERAQPTRSSAYHGGEHDHQT